MRTGVVIHKHKFYANGAQKQTYMLFQNDVRIDLACHGSNLSMQVAAIRDISRSCLDANEFTVLNCIVKGHASLSPPSLRLRLCSCFSLLAT
ncbi:hypothetical protein TNCV_4932961 [Trichonephila clavipes]|nr:hypothetical protein TNCV_4932961 [Trichonephila clavipes]